MLVFFISALFGIQQQTARTQEIYNERLAMELAGVINDELQVAEEVHQDYRREFILPANLDGSNYNLSRPDPYELIVGFRGKNYVYFLYNELSIAPLQPGYNTVFNS